MTKPPLHPPEEERFSLPDEPHQSAKRLPSSDDQQLWNRVIAEAIPLSSTRHHTYDRTSLTAYQKPTLSHKPSAPAPPRATLHAHAPAALDKAFLRRIKIGRMAIERRIDLHDLNEADAHARFYSALVEAYQQQMRLILVITGKGGVQAQGVLRRVLPRWCAEPECAFMISGMHKALAQDGGDGAYYLRIKRIRTEPYPELYDE